MYYSDQHSQNSRFKVWLYGITTSVTNGAETAYPSEHMSSHDFTPVFSGIRVSWSLVLCVCFVDGCLSFYTFPFVHCVVCFPSICGFWLHLWYLQTLLNESSVLQLFTMHVTISKFSPISKIPNYNNHNVHGVE
jgi:hypothetical protein